MLDLITPVNDNFRRDLSVYDPNLVDPTNANSIEQGEWLQPDATGKLVRLGAAPTKPGAMQVFSQKGDMAVQALGKISVLQLHEYEAETDMFAAGAYAIGDRLTVKQITVDTVTRSGLAQAATGDFIYGVVTKSPADNGGKLRFQKASGYQAHAV